jgi:hypothetical protein
MKHVLLVFGALVEFSEVDSEVKEVGNELVNSLFHRLAASDYVELQALDDVEAVRLQPPDPF